MKKHRAERYKRNDKGRVVANDIKDVTSDHLTGLYRTNKKTENGTWIWVVECDCGKRLEMMSSEFKKRFSCGCKKRPNPTQFKARDLTGVVMNDVEVLYPTDKRKSTYVVWVMRCLLCNEVFERGAYTVTRGTLKHRCPAYYKKYGPTRIGRPYIPNQGGHVNDLYGKLRRNAAYRGIRFNLSKEEARALFEGACAYCGAAPSPRHTASTLYGTYNANGIDRVDSKKGYALGNCVSCCKYCNVAKNTMTLEEFKAWLKRAHDHLFGVS